MENNDWADWEQSDWGNGWTTNPFSQNSTRQQIPKEQGNSNHYNRQNKVNQSASGYFENNSTPNDDWFVQNQSHNYPGQTPSYSVENINNNSINQIENREVAPPDNKLSYESRQNHNDPNQPRSNPYAARSKGMAPRQPVYKNIGQSNISNYFEPNKENQTGYARPQYTSQGDNYSMHSGTSSISGENHEREQFRNDQQFSSLGHQSISLENSSSSLSQNKQVNRPPMPENLNISDQINDMPYPLLPKPDVPFSQQHSGVLRHTSDGKQPPPPLAQSFGPPSQQQSFRQHPAHSKQNSFGQQDYQAQQPSFEQQQSQAQHHSFGQQEHQVQQQFFGPPQPQSLNNQVNSEPPRPPRPQRPSSQDHYQSFDQYSSQQLFGQPQSQKQQLSFDQKPQPVPFGQQTTEIGQQSFSPKQYQGNQKSFSQKQPQQYFEQQQPQAQQPSSIQHPSHVQQEPFAQQSSQDLHQPFSQLQPQLRKQSFEQQSPEGQKSATPPQNSLSSQLGQLFQSSNKVPQQESATTIQQSFSNPGLASGLYSGAHIQSTNIAFNQQVAEQNQQSSDDQNPIPQPSSVDMPLDQQSSDDYQQVFSTPQDVTSTQHQPPNSNCEQPMLTGQPPSERISHTQSNEFNQADNRLTPSPQQQMPSQMSRVPPSQFSQLVPSCSESQSVNTTMNINVNNVKQSAFHVPSKKAIHPIAASSPLPSINQNVENQEAIPDNKEYPDSTENIARDLKALKITPPQENEVEGQKHCAIDRNQYLETGQFSAQKENNTYMQNIEANDEGEAPPPGLHRLVTGQGYEPWQPEPAASPHSGQGGEGTPGLGATRQSTPLSSIGGESEGRDDKDRRREVPGEAEPLQGRVVLGQVPTPPQDTGSNRTDRDRLERMVVGEHGQSGNTSDDYRQSGRPIRHLRHARNDSSYEEDERDYSSDRDRRKEDHRHRDRDERPRRRREHRSPEYRSDEEYEDRRGYHRSGRESHRRREFSPDRSYYRDYYREEDSRHHRSYYSRDYDDYYRENQRSRPSSRSGSDYRGPMKHPMRVLPGHHYYDPYMTVPSYHDYNLKYSQRTLEYFERMRHVDPAGYAAWYSQYMQGKMMQESNRAFSSDRASVHSGQSSSNQRQGISTPQEVVDDLTREEEDIYYGAKFYDSAHIKGSIDSHGRLIIIEPNYPLDHQKAVVNLCRMPQISLDRDSEEFFQSPGPFIPGITHRNTVLQYLKKISDRSTKTSEKLLYDLVHMTVKGKGEVNGSDVAELLMDSYKKSMQEERDPSEERTTPVSSKEVTSRFRELLQQGNKTEALEWAMDNGAWGHALFLASKMGERTHNDIMLRFANSIPHNDPLQTLYQLMSGYIPQSATCCADKKWSDWRPHLAMILSNPTGNSELDRQAIITLGDSLNASGRLFASHFCYITAQVEFSQFRPESKLVLLGSSLNQDFSKFATCRAIMLTMCYEYGLKLKQPNFSIPTLQVYKLILAVRLIDSGRMKNALQYCELLASELLGGNTPAQKSLVSTVIDISLRLKMLDPVLALSGNSEKDPDWLANLKYLHQTLPDEQGLSNNQSPITVAEPPEISHPEVPYHISDSQPPSFMDPGSGPVSIGVPSYSVQHNTSQANIPSYQPLNTPHHGYQHHTQSSQLPPRSQSEQMPPEDMYHQSSFVQPSSMMQPSQQHNSLAYLPAQMTDGLPGNVDGPTGAEPPSWEQRPAPVIHTSSEPSHSARNSFFKATEEQLKAVDESKPSLKVLNEVGSGEKKKDEKPMESKGSGKSEEQSSGWFGGIWDKLALRPKNQMRLPDDSNPSIVWDEKKKRWVNLDGDSETSGNAKPPPKASEATLPPQGNKYKIQKGKLMKSNYVDVMGNKEKTDNGSANFISNTLPPPAKTNFFIPSPIEGNDNAPIDFITPAAHNPVIDSADHNKPQLSRSSSVSSVSREVQFYMTHPKNYRQATRGPGNASSMYNTSRFSS